MLVFASFKILTLTLRSCQYIDLLIDEYSLRVLSKKKSIIDFDDLYLLLYTHWVFDDSTFKDERQRIQVAIDLLTIAFFDCRSCSLFDTRIKFDSNNSNAPIDTTVSVVPFGEKRITNAQIGETSDSKSTRNNDTWMSINAASEVDDEINKHWGDNNDSDLDLSCDYSENCDTNDDCNVELEET